ncbi:hypothetical protein BC359_18995 [Priestia flexa]|nr:hypothetical protein BC359_18995 [Priestia flexa]
MTNTSTAKEIHSYVLSEEKQQALYKRILFIVSISQILGGAGLAAGGALSGVIVAGSSFPTLSLVGGMLSLLLIPVVAWQRRSKQ